MTRPKKVRTHPSVNDRMPTILGRARPHYTVPGYNVFEAALDRIRWLHDEFDGKLFVSSSGGKDSTIIMELAIMVARERGTLPVRVSWLDQECEFEATRNYQRWVADRPEVDFEWYQVPFKLSNSTNQRNPWLNVWDPDPSVEWVREKEPDSIHVNDFVGPDGKPVERFGAMLAAINERHGPGAHLTGLRGEESPARRLLLTSNPAYKYATWSAKLQHKGEPVPGAYHFYPVYDWHYWDVWKAINDNGWKYNTHYDDQYRYGIQVHGMRVSNYHHETALRTLHFLQEIEPQTWERATRRLEGISTHAHLRGEQMPAELPYMFSSWEEYMHHLINNLAGPQYRDLFRGFHAKVTRACPWESKDALAKLICRMVIGNDIDGTTLGTFIIVSRRNLPGTPAKVTRKAKA